MSEEKKKGKDKKRGPYEPPLEVKADFLQLIQTVVKDAKKKDKKKP